MSARPQSDVEIKNRLLLSLPPRKYRGLLSGLEPVALSLDQVLYEEQEPHPFSYFPNDVLISLIANKDGRGRSIEIGFVDERGALCANVGVKGSRACYRAVAQTEGTVFRVADRLLAEALGKEGPLTGYLLRHSQALLAQISRAVVCNKFHRLGERLARWLLVRHDYARSDLFRITHESMARMLGENRARVTQTANALLKAGVISYSRGQMRILDRDALEAASCDCYATVKEMSDRLLDY